VQGLDTAHVWCIAKALRLGAAMAKQMAKQKACGLEKNRDFTN
jgi:hypothetical protein